MAVSSFVRLSLRCLTIIRSYHRGQSTCTAFLGPPVQAVLALIRLYHGCQSTCEAFPGSPVQTVLALIRLYHGGQSIYTAFLGSPVQAVCITDNVISRRSVHLCSFPGFASTGRLYH